MRQLSKFSEDFIKTLPAQIGDYVVFKGVSTFWFTNIIKDAEDNLVIGQKYKIKFIDPAGSWTAVVLEEFPNLKFNYHWFELAVIAK